MLMSKSSFTAPGVADPLGPYSNAVVAGDFIFLAGQIGVDAAGRVVGKTAAEQARQALVNMTALLAAAGLTTDDVVKVSLFLADIDDLPAVNEVYEEYFTPPYPAREPMQVVALFKGLRFEMAVTAYRG
jgi:2-iminobutanoate/2-iminopropanoate deaminase